MRLNRNVLFAFLVILICSSVAIATCKDSDSKERNTTANTEQNAIPNNSERIKYVASVYPLKMILDELTGGRAQVDCFMGPGASPHTFEPSPADITNAANAAAFFWVNENLDGWAVNIEMKNKVNVVDLLQSNQYMYFDHHHEIDESKVDHEHDSSETHIRDSHIENHNIDEKAVDPHFWTSPRTVLALIESLTDKLIEIDPQGTSIYKKNAENFSNELNELNAEVNQMLLPFKGEYLILFHPSFLYYMRDYELRLAGIIEPSPGKEPSPKQIAELRDLAMKYKVKAFFTEPQLSRQSVEVLVSETGLRLFELDPLGGNDGRTTYRSLILYNTEILIRAFGDE